MPSRLPEEREVRHSPTSPLNGIFSGGVFDSSGVFDREKMLGTDHAKNVYSIADMGLSALEAQFGKSKSAGPDLPMHFMQQVLFVIPRVAGFQPSYADGHRVSFGSLAGTSSSGLRGRNLYEQNDADMVPSLSEGLAR